MNKKRIAIVATGGTIAATTSQATQLHDYNVTEGVGSLIQAVPGLHGLATLEEHQLFNVDSRDLSSAQQLHIAQFVQKLLLQPHIDGVVITHGTDTLEETAFLLQLYVYSNKPVVLTGAMRPASAYSADGALNLYQAVLTASSPYALERGVMVVLNDTIHSASYSRKTHTTAVGAFQSVNGAIIGSIDADGAHFFTGNKPLSLGLTQITAPLPQVDIIYDHPDANLAIYQAVVNSQSAGVVIAAVGNGSLSTNANTGARLLASRNIPCIRASRIAAGRVTHSALDQNLGTIAAESLSPAQARVLLQLAIASHHNQDDIRQLIQRFSR